MKKFIASPPLNLNGFRFAEVDKRFEVIHIQVDDEVSDCFNVKEATLLRDWLNKALGENSTGECPDCGCSHAPGCSQSDRGEKQ